MGCNSRLYFNGFWFHGTEGYTQCANPCRGKAAGRPGAERMVAAGFIEAGDQMRASGTGGAGADRGAAGQLGMAGGRQGGDHVDRSGVGPPCKTVRTAEE